MPWIPQILHDQSRELIVQKASQVGASTAFIIYLLWLCKFNIAPRGVIYWLPSGDDVRDFVNTKFDDFIKENEDLSRSIFEDNKDPNNQGLKKIFGVQTFWRGLKSKSKVKSISADADIFDEYDEADPGQIKQAEKRTAASSIQLRRRLSTPTIPDFGINSQFKQSDQCHFSFRCGSCNTLNILELTFPNCFKINKDGDYYHACHKCSSPLDITKGSWISQNSSSKLRGYQISQLYSPFVTPNEIMKEFRTTEFIGHFYNHVVGQPYISSTDRVSEDQVLGMCDPTRSISNLCQWSTVMGIDQGKKLHCVILDSKKKNKVLWLGVLDHFEDVDHVMKRFNVKHLVIDALPETRKARELMLRNKSKVWLNFYNDNQKGSYAWKEDERIVSVNRTESLDVGTNAILAGDLYLPQRSRLTEEFAKHCSAIVKTIDENKETRAKRYVYKALAADHFRHALNYAQIAQSLNQGSSPISIMRY